MKFALISIIVIFISGSAFSEEVVYPPSDQDISYDREQLVTQAGIGFANVIREEKTAWYDCGLITKKEEYDIRGIHIARSVKDALDEVGLRDPRYLWGALGIIYQESRGNACAVGPNSRSWAKEKNVLKTSKHWTRYTKEDVLSIVNSKEFKKRRVGAAAGIGQTIYPHNTNIFDSTTNSIRNITPDELFTVEGGAKTIAFHMLTNTQFNKKRPWVYWPGSPYEKYARVLAMHVSRMGGPYKKIYNEKDAIKTQKSID